MEVNSLLTVLVWSRGLLPTGTTSQQEQSWPRAGLCGQHQTAYQHPVQILRDAQMQPSGPQGGRAKLFYLSMYGLKLALELREAKLTDKADIKESHPESSREPSEFLETF